MTRILDVLRAGPGISVQDTGRPGWLAHGLSRGGAMDRLALAEGAALLSQSEDCAALEIGGSFVSVQASCDLRIALTGAPMRATLDGIALAWNASHPLPAGARLDLSALTGGYGYLHVGGGIATPLRLGSRSAHLAAGIDAAVATGQTLPVGDDPGTGTGRLLDPADRFSGGTIRMIEGPQTSRFPADTLHRFQNTVFVTDVRGNRMGKRLIGNGDGFANDSGLTLLSDTVLPGDIQITGDGTPFVLLAECQTTGGYPRIGTILPSDLPRLVQAPSGTALRFVLVSLQTGAMLEEAEHQRRADLHRNLRPLVRDPRDMPDLLGYQLIGGVTAGDELDRGT
jgi:biotin-dependent carboxylase-like uncharacterized protein